MTRTGTTDIYLSLKEVSQVRLQYSVVVEQGDAWVQGSSPKPISRIALLNIATETAWCRKIEYIL